ALAACLSGCATKNPLIDDAPAPQAAATVTTAAAASTTTATPAADGGASGTAPVASAAESGVKAGVGSGVTTTGPTQLQRVFGIFSPYRITLQQGNFVSEQMVAQPQPGTTQGPARRVPG